MDTVNSTLAHSAPTRMPSEFYDEKSRANIDKIACEEWYSGFRESNEYRTVGIGSLAGDIVARMVGNTRRNGQDGLEEVGGGDDAPGKGRGGENNLRFAMTGCHDTTLAGLLTAIGAFGERPWPPYTSHVAVELFRDVRTNNTISTEGAPSTPAPKNPSQNQSWLGKLFSSGSSTAAKPGTAAMADVSLRKPLQEMAPTETATLSGHYVRVRYNDEPMTIPACKLPGNHFEGDETFCTLVSHSNLTQTPSFLLSFSFSKEGSPENLEQH